MGLLLLLRAYFLRLKPSCIFNFNHFPSSGAFMKDGTINHASLSTLLRSLIPKTAHQEAQPASLLIECAMPSSQIRANVYGVKAGQQVSVSCKRASLSSIIFTRFCLRISISISKFTNMCLLSQWDFAFRFKLTRQVGSMGLGTS